MVNMIQVIVEKKGTRGGMMRVELVLAMMM